jgi:hypothetical protein
MRHPDIVTASEIGNYGYCAESSRLAALGHESANQPERDAGTARHARRRPSVSLAAPSPSGEP